eukprot:11155922-Lingulodinium_polyedra.AAC.1
MGSTTLSTALAAKAASMALPPLSSRLKAACVAFGCAVAAMPLVEIAGDRDVLGCPTGRQPPQPQGGASWSTASQL